MLEISRYFILNDSVANLTIYPRLYKSINSNNNIDEKVEINKKKLLARFYFSYAYHHIWVFNYYNGEEKLTLSNFYHNMRIVNIRSIPKDVYLPKLCRLCKI